MRGRVVKLGDQINTDLIISGKFKFKGQDLRELSDHLFEDLDPSLSKRMVEGTILVAGRNFGCGSSREHAPRLLRMKGVQAVVATSFARIFYRNAINIGLPPISASSDFVDETHEGDDLEVDMENSLILNHSRRLEWTFKPFPHFISKILQKGGIVEYIKEYGEFPWNTR